MNIKLEVPDSFLKEETRNGYYVSADTKKVWAVELDLLCELDRVCQKHGLKYYVDSGTLLGAIRHKGFIPWDDDIDVVMLREDYDRFISLADEFQDPYFLQTAYTDEGYIRGHAQIRNSSTTGMLRKEALSVPYNQGIFLDVFPVDFHNKLAFFDFIKLKKCQLAKRKLSLYTWDGSGEKNLKYAFKKIAQKPLRKKDFYKLYKKYESASRNTFMKGNTVDKWSFYLDHKKNKNIPIDYFDEIVYLDFEFLKVPAPHKYHEMMVLFYGENYMTPLNIPTDHGDVIFDTERSYKEVIAEMMKGESQ